MTKNAKAPIEFTLVASATTGRRGQPLIHQFAPDTDRCAVLLFRDAESAWHAVQHGPSELRRFEPMAVASIPNDLLRGVTHVAAVRSWDARHFTCSEPLSIEEWLGGKNVFE
jgi:hypothetical protein